MANRTLAAAMADAPLLNSIRNDNSNGNLDPSNDDIRWWQRVFNLWWKPLCTAIAIWSFFALLFYLWPNVPVFDFFLIPCTALPDRFEFWNEDCTNVSWAIWPTKDQISNGTDQFDEALRDNNKLRVVRLRYFLSWTATLLIIGASAALCAGYYIRRERRKVHRDDLCNKFWPWFIFNEIFDWSLCVFVVWNHGFHVKANFVLYWEDWRLLIGTWPGMLMAQSVFFGDVSFVLAGLCGVPFFSRRLQRLKDKCTVAGLFWLSMSGTASKTWAFMAFVLVLSMLYSQYVAILRFDFLNAYIEHYFQVDKAKTKEIKIIIKVRDVGQAPGDLHTLSSMRERLGVTISEIHPGCKVISEIHPGIVDRYNASASWDPVKAGDRIVKEYWTRTGNHLHLTIRRIVNQHIQDYRIDNASETLNGWYRFADNYNGKPRYSKQDTSYLYFDSQRESWILGTLEENDSRILYTNASTSDTPPIGTWLPFGESTPPCTVHEHTWYELLCARGKCWQWILGKIEKSTKPCFIMLALLNDTMFAFASFCLGCAYHWSPFILFSFAMSVIKPVLFPLLRIFVLRAQQDLKSLYGFQAMVWNLLVDIYRAFGIFWKCCPQTTAHDLKWWESYFKKQLADNLHKLGYVSQALDLRQEIVKAMKNLMEEQGKEPGYDYFMAQHALAQSLAVTDQVEKAIEVETQAQEGLEYWLRTNPDLARMNNLLFFCKQKIGVTGAQAEDQEREFEKYKKQLGPKHKQTLECMAGLARQKNMIGMWKEAKEMRQEIVRYSKEKFGERDEFTIKSIMDLAYSIRDEENFKEAEREYKQAMRLSETHGPDHPLTLKAKTFYAECRRAHDQGQARQALGMLDDIMTKFPSEWIQQDHQDVVMAKTFKANAHRDLGELEIAAELHREVIKIREKKGKKEPMWNSMGDLALDLLAFAEQQKKNGNETNGQIVEVKNATERGFVGKYVKTREDDDGRPMYEKEKDKSYVIKFDGQQKKWTLCTGQVVYSPQVYDDMQVAEGLWRAQDGTECDVRIPKSAQEFAQEAVDEYKKIVDGWRDLNPEHPKVLKTKGKIYRACREYHLDEPDNSWPLLTRVPTDTRRIETSMSSPPTDTRRSET